MGNQPKPPPGSSARGQASQDARAERQAKALRDNLHRRKQQARGRIASDDGDSEEPATDSPIQPDNAE